jgi:hypothetical protein
MTPPRNPELLERKRQVRGLVLLAIAALAFAILRAGGHHLWR